MIKQGLKLLKKYGAKYLFFVVAIVFLYNMKICSGLYLNETFDAVKEFQKKNKLPLTGIVDEKTYKMIMA